MSDGEPLVRSDMPLISGGTEGDSIEALLAESRPPLLAFLAVIALTAVTIGLVLAFGTIGYTVSCSGVLRSLGDSPLIASPYPGTIVTVPNPDEKVDKGRVLVQMSDPTLAMKLDRLKAEKAVLRGKRDSIKTVIEATGLYSEGSNNLYGRVLASHEAHFKEWRGRVEDQTAVREKALKELNRSIALQKAGASTDKETADARFGLAAAEKQLQILRDEFTARLATELLAVEDSLRRSSDDEQLVEAEQLARKILAPCAGNWIPMRGISQGATVAEGTPLGYISVDGKLVIEAFVAGSEIGKISEGQTAVAHIDAFPFTHWGSLECVVAHVAHDTVEVGGEPVLRVLLRPTTEYLRSSNGRTATLRRGLTAQIKIATDRMRFWEMLAMKARDYVE